MANSSYIYFEPDKVGKLGNLSILVRRAVEGFITGLHRSPHKGFSVEFSEHREYTPGDDLRHLDWVAWGRTDRYYIKQYEQETNLRAYILLDSSASMNYRYGASTAAKGAAVAPKSVAPTKFQYGCYLAACLSYLMCRQQDVVGAIAFDSKVRFHLSPGSAPAHLDRLFKLLEGLTPGKRTAMAGTFHELADTLARRGLVVVISDLYDDQSEVLKALQHFVYKKHQVIIFHLMDPAELELPFKKIVTLVDMETDQRLQVDPRYIKDAYQAQIQEFIGRYKKECSDRNIEYVLTTTDTPYDIMLLNYLSRRKALLK
jgi:uncharacterized protein (DUF58 family)